MLELGPKSGWSMFISWQKFEIYVLKSPLAASAQVYTFRVMQYIRVTKIFFHKIRFMGIKKTQNFT
jgi:hypothetical protein